MDVQRNSYEDEIDLREVIRVLLDGWRWIVMATIGGATLALVVTLLLPKKYESSASIVLIKPDVVYNFDPRITTELTVPPSEGLPELVTSRGLLTEVLERARREGVNTGDLTPADFSEQIDASFSGTVLILKVEDASPDRSAALANTWAAAVAQRLNEVYAGSYDDQLRFAEQAQGAFVNWQDAQQALVAFQSASREAILEERVGSLRDELRSLLTAQVRYDMVVADAQAILDRLSAGDQTTAVVQNSLASLTLTLNALGSSASGLQTHAEGAVVSQAGSSAPQFLLQVDVGDLLASPTDEQEQFLTDLIDSVEQQTDGIDSRISAIEASIPELQGQLTEAQEARTTLETERDLAAGAYQALSQQTRESLLVAGNDSGVVSIASPATPPSKPAGRGLMLSSVLAGFVLFLLSSFALLFIDWWHSADEGRDPRQ